jgi:hypothetical protein
MPAYLPIPDGLKVPESKTFDLMTTYTVDEGQLYPLAVDGIEFPDVEAPETEKVAGQEEASGQEMPPAAGAKGPNSFASAVEMAMSKQK